MSTLKKVLAAFEDTSTPLSITQIAHQLNVSPAMVEDMINFWVRKGKLRDSNACEGSCSTPNIPTPTCSSSKGGCPFVMEMPKRYELVQSQDKQPAKQTLSSGLISIVEIR